MEGKSSIGAPALLDVTWQERNMLVDWVGASGATRHVLKVFDEKNRTVEKIVLKVKERAVFQMSYKCGYGMTCKFVIEASAPGVETKTASKILLIGGDVSVADVVLTKDQLCPRRALIVRWKPPVKRPRCYIVQLYEVMDNIFMTVVEVEIENTQQSYRFFELKTSTIYLCEVCPQYDNDSKDGAFSNQEKTGKRVAPSYEALEYFGIPDLIKHNGKNDAANNLVVELAWNQIQVGENYKIKNYIVEVFQRQRHFLTKTIFFKSELTAETSKVAIENLKRGQKYYVAFATKCQDLDKQDKPNYFTKEYSFCTSPSITQIKKCQVSEGVVFSWEPVEGANKYRLIIKDEFLSQNVGHNEIICGKVSTVMVQMSDILRIGKTCLTKVITYANNLTSETEWKAHLIGGDMAVTDVVAEKCQDCPRREMVVKWKPPKLNPEGYKVQLLVVKEKDKYIEHREVTTLEPKQLSHKLEELKTSTQYLCKVMPIYGGVTMNGSLSNMVQTDERMNGSFETEVDFGAPKEIVHVDKGSDSKGFIVMLSWKRDPIGENYKLLHQQLTVSQYKGLRSLPLVDKMLTATISETEIRELELGYNFIVKLTSTMIDLDTEKNFYPKKEYNFDTKPSKPRLHDCVCKDGLLIFTWESVKGANKYRLEIKDEFLREEITKSETVIGKCEVKVQASEKLCIGRTCMTRVITYINDQTSETDWKVHLIGGVLVPRNVKASPNSDNPMRSILVAFDTPERGPADEYKIVAIPENGKRKTLFCKSNTEIFEFLRKGIRYKFQVHAKHRGKWSEGSTSNYQNTYGGDVKVYSPWSLSGMKGTLNMQHSVIHGTTTVVNTPKGEEFGKVRDLMPALNPHERYEKDILTLSWKLPAFDNNAFDYKVENYKVEIRKDGQQVEEFSLDFNKKLDTYLTGPQQLDLGGIYEILVSTVYIDIDHDEEYISNAERTTVQTRPCKPSGVKTKVIANDTGEEALKIEWNAVKGAERYEVEIYTDDHETEPYKREHTGKETIWHQTFDEGFGYGTSYYAVITVFGGENKANFVKTDRETIGGDLSPKRVRATINHHKVIDQNTQLYLSWELPAKHPASYEVSYEKFGKVNRFPCEKTECLITDLTAGEYYCFKVVAIHRISGNPVKSGASYSNKIQTNPTPSQVKNVHTRLVNNPSTSIEIHWDKVDKKDELTTYRVTVMSTDETIRREIKNIMGESLCISGLEPDTEYFTTVAGGNRTGFGRSSEKCFFTTELASPMNVQLLHNHCCMNLSLKFSEAQGEPLKHICSLYKRQREDPYQSNVEVRSGQIFVDLEPNTEYFALVHAEFENERCGKAVKSATVLTAPSKPEIHVSRCCVYNNTNSAREFLLEWKPDKSCKEHEILIKHGDEVEHQLTVKNMNVLRYLCQHEASQYFVRVRTKNQLFGPWSDEVIIHLAPAKLKNIIAKLEEDGSNITIQCNKATSGYFLYFCRAFCDGQTEADPMQILPDDEKDTVNFSFKPTQYAKTYHFELWARDARGLLGETTNSNNVISRPASGKITNLTTREENPSTDILISWESLDRCDKYDILIEEKGCQEAESYIQNIATSCCYRCQHPGSIYSVRVRGICLSVHGYWSEKRIVHLKPAQVELVEDSNSQEPVESVQVKWKELAPKPTGYQVILYQSEKQISEAKTENLYHEFPKSVVNPGSLCYCTVAAYNSAGVGKSTKSRSYHLKWNMPKDLMTKLDVNDPSRRAIISWDKPDGVNCFRLEIEHHQTGSVTKVKLSENSYIFKSGLPGNSYELRVYSGCDGFYDIKCLKVALTMEPEPPTAVEAKSLIYLNGIKVFFKDNPGPRKSYEVCVIRLDYPENKKIVATEQESAILKDLVPGAFYEVSVVSVIENTRSKEAKCPDSIQTYPDEVKNLRSKQDGKSIIYEWDSLEIAPREYKVQWKVDNNIVVDDSTVKTRYKIFSVKPGQSYSLRVTASNSAGDGRISPWNTCETESESQDLGTLIPEARASGSLRDGIWMRIEGTKILYREDKPLRENSNVFEAEREDATDTEEKVVVKFIPNYKKKNKLEVQCLKELVGRGNVVTYFQSGFCKYHSLDAIFIVMERCEMLTLFDRIQIRKKSKDILDFAKCKRDLRCIATGLRHLKENHIIHRDLKPHNILYRGNIPVISDFGLSKQHRVFKSNTPQSRDNIGTRGWIAPEASKIGGKTSHASDIYSAGLVFYHDLTDGQHPYGDVMDSWQTYINDDEDGSKCNLKPLRETPDEAIASDLVESMLSRDPNNRPTIEAVLKHPFFWDEEKKLNFFSNSHKAVEYMEKTSGVPGALDLNLLSGKYGKQVASEIESWKTNLLLNDTEKNMIENNFKQKDINVEVKKDAMEVKAKKYKDSAKELLRFIRNRRTHDHDDKAEEAIDMTEEQFYNFFSGRFPHFFIYVFSKFEGYYIQKQVSDKDFSTTIAKYFIEAT